MSSVPMTFLFKKKRTNISYLILLACFLCFSLPLTCYATASPNVENKGIISFNTPNTVYTISSDIDLHGQTVNIASNCSLYFNGGSFSNGMIIGKNTRIVAPFGKIFNSNVNLKGTFCSDKILISWWTTVGINDNTKEVQQALNSILLFSNRIVLFDVPVRITDVEFVLKWYPGVKFLGVSNSYQNKASITVFGTKSQGLDISGTENLRFENILFEGCENDPPRTLLFASRCVDNKQCQGHHFKDVNFYGRVTSAFVYNYAGELWHFQDCSFRLSKTSICKTLFYGTSINSLGLLSKFGQTETNTTPFTCTYFTGTTFSNITSCPSTIFEGGKNSSGKLRNTASICFDKCYFYTPKSTTAKFYNVQGAITFQNSVDESGADSNAEGNDPLYEFTGDIQIQGITFFNNTIYSRKNSCIIDSNASVRNYTGQSNYIINANAKWRFNQLYDSRHYGLSTTEFFCVLGKNSNVIVEGGKSSHVSVKK